MAVSAAAGIPMAVSEADPERAIYSSATDKASCFFVISKVHQEHLSVYEAVGEDTVLLATYPVCIARNKGPKERTGDNKTPESWPGTPFRISTMQDASGWTHDFGDGRGAILAYGHWFMRLVTPGFSGIGIHGSTGNRESIKAGRGSEGCIRLYDEDIVHLHDNYAVVGTPVIILPEDQGPLPFEMRAMAARGLGTVPQLADPVPSQEKVVAERPSRRSRKGLFQKVDNSDGDAQTVEAQPEPKRYVTVRGTRQRLRTGASPDYPFYTGGESSPKCPSDGDVLELLGEDGNYFKVVFDGQELYINKISCEEAR